MSDTQPTTENEYLNSEVSLTNRNNERNGSSAKNSLNNSQKNSPREAPKYSINELEGINHKNSLATNIANLPISESEMIDSQEYIQDSSGPSNFNSGRLIDNNTPIINIQTDGREQEDDTPNNGDNSPRSEKSAGSIQSYMSKAIGGKKKERKKRGKRESRKSVIEKSDLGQGPLGLRGLRTREGSDSLDPNSRKTIDDINSESKTNVDLDPQLEAIGEEDDYDEDGNLIPGKSKQATKQELGILQSQYETLAILENEEEEENQETPSKYDLDNGQADQRDVGDELKPQCTNTKSFFMAKGKGNFEDIQRERKWRLKKIKKEHLPIDYKKLREHELSFLAKIYEKKEKKKEEMKKNLIELEKNYQVAYKSKKYMQFRGSYSQDRNNVRISIDKSHKDREMSKKYGEKIRELNLPAIEKGNMLEQLEQRFPKEGKGHDTWFYGRFGEKVWNRNKGIQKDSEIMKVRMERGNQCMEDNKKRMLSGDLLKEHLEKKEQEDLRRKNSYIEKNKNISKSIDYLKQMRKSTDMASNTPLNLRKAALDVKNYFAKKPEEEEVNKKNYYSVDLEKKSLMISRINNFDKITKRKEQRLRMKADTNLNGSQDETMATREGIEDYYLHSIKAKLSLLDEL